MKLSNFLLFATAYLTAHPAGLVSCQGLGTTVNLPDGPIFGSSRNSNGILSFKGIPYAAPPVGQLRWRSPSPALTRNSILNATTFGNSCWSYLSIAPPPTPQSEDCLTANIWTGASQADEKLPVMAWIYGGGFQFGSSAEPRYDGSTLATQGVVLVSFNYREGALGFLALSELDDEGPYPSGNFGLQDQLFLLQWVRRNIAAFGGDPDNITIFGESAGAHAVGILVSSPLSKGLFHKAILESGAFWDAEHGSLPTFAEARRLGSALITKLGSNSLTTLRSLPAIEIVNAALYNPILDPENTVPGPSVDHCVLPVAPPRAFTEGRQMRIPILAGWNKVDQLPFLPLAIPHTSVHQFETDAELYFRDRTGQFLSLYPAGNISQATASAQALIGDLVIREQTWEAVDDQSKHTNVPVYAYYYTYTSAYSPVAAHTAEIPFVFGTLTLNRALGSTKPPASEDRALSQKMMAYWTNFAKYGNPNNQAAGLPYWPAYSGNGEGERGEEGEDCGRSSARGVNILGLGNAIAPVHYPLDRFKFIRSLRRDGILPRYWRSINITALNLQT